MNLFNMSRRTSFQSMMPLVRPNGITRYSNFPNLTGVEGGLPLIPLTNPDKMVGVPQFGKDPGSMEGTKSRVEEG